MAYWELYNSAYNYNKDHAWDEISTFGPMTKIEPYDACGYLI